MSEHEQTEDYRMIFDAARLNASLRIQELDDAVELSAISVVADMVRSSAMPRQHKVLEPHRTEKPMDSKGIGEAVKE